MSDSHVIIDTDGHRRTRSSHSPSRTSLSCYFQSSKSGGYSGMITLCPVALIGKISTRRRDRRVRSRSTWHRRIAGRLELMLKTILFQSKSPMPSTHRIHVKVSKKEEFCQKSFSFALISTAHHRYTRQLWNMCHNTP